MKMLLVKKYTLSQEEQDKILSKYLTAGFTGDTENTGDIEEVEDTEDNKDKEGYFSRLFSQPDMKGLGEEIKQSRKALYLEYLKEISYK